MGWDGVEWCERMVFIVGTVRTHTKLTGSVQSRGGMCTLVAESGSAKRGGCGS